ncbi:STYKc, partial [Musa troglodytarum]
TAPFSPPSRLPNPEPSESHNTTPVSVFLRHGLVEKHASPTPVLVCLDSSRSSEGSFSWPSPPAGSEGDLCGVVPFCSAATVER